ncbi:hypothetical protein PanWU01x14_238060 [Parasponia andersonii]|uniref:Uncharacterized protein n=1 Tax=Parasponia andersonii TaxID=3476 RepID=A0A2P5BHN5_PARAD|nr:hypothetical protein PanWU01x14_238060 [Parasponia andersonii]
MTNGMLEGKLPVWNEDDTLGSLSYWLLDQSPWFIHYAQRLLFENIEVSSVKQLIDALFFPVALILFALTCLLIRQSPR